MVSRAPVCVFVGRRVLKGTTAQALPRPVTGPLNPPTRLESPGWPPHRSRAYLLELAPVPPGQQASREAAAWHGANRGTVEPQRTVALCPERAPVGAQLPSGPPWRCWVWSPGGAWGAG